MLTKRSRIGLAAAVLAVILVAKSGRAQAQDLEPPRHRQGYYVSLGLYGFVSEVREKGLSLGPWAGAGGAFRIGQLVTRRFGLGLAIENGKTSGEGQTAGITALGVEASWALRGNLAARGGVGIGFIRLHDPDDPFESSTRGATGSWFSLGLGYDWFPAKSRVTGGFSLTPTLQVRYLPGDETSGFVAYAGLEFGYWTGLPKNQLELPPSEAWRK